MADNLNSINSIEQNEHKGGLLERIRNSGKKVLAPVLAAGSISLGGLPAATIPATGAAVATVLTACSDDEPDNPNDTIAPTVNVSQHDVDITGGKQVRISGNQLYIGDVLVASWTDNVTKNCTVELSLNGKTISSGTTISEEGYLTVKVRDEAGNTKTIDIKLTINNQLISGLENLRNLEMKVDQEVNLLNGITFGNGASLAKVEIEMDGQTTQITDPQHYKPEYPGTCTIILTVKDKNGNIVTEKVNKNIQALEYQAMEINNISPAEILPITSPSQIEVGDKNAYNHIEHLRIAEVTRIRDMMWKYGAGNHSAAEYQQLMSRLNTGMTMEQPIGYDDYELIGGTGSETPSNHAHSERHILKTLINHSNFIVQNGGNRSEVIYNKISQDPNKIYIFGNSTFGESDKSRYNTQNTENWKRLSRSPNFIVFVAGGNIRKSNGILKNKILHENVDGDEHGVYSLPSSTNGKNNTDPNNHLIVTIGTNSSGNIDQTNETYSSSKYPVGFHNNNLFSGRTFPTHSSASGKIEAEAGKYATSRTNYVNVAIADLCFQMFAEVPNVDQLLNMIRSSTDLRDHIKFNGEDQSLILMNPAGFFKKYDMPTNLPTQINVGETISLNKGYYKGIIFDIPGAEVKINGQWIAYNEANKSVIKSQNPMNLEWRLNGNLCAKMGYKGKTINGKIIAIDDSWNGLNINNPITITIN